MRKKQIFSIISVHHTVMLVMNIKLHLYADIHCIHKFWPLLHTAQFMKVDCFQYE